MEAGSLDWALGGVDTSAEAVGGEECMNFIPTNQKIAESCIIIPIALFQMYWGWVNMPRDADVTISPGNVLLRTTLLIGLALTFGMEIAFKLASRQMIWIVNPCHVITMLQILLLSLPPTKTSNHLLRCLCHATNGPIIALLFPLIHTRFFYFEISTYFLQHWLIVLIPWLLVALDDSYSLEERSDWSYNVLTLGSFMLYHWVPLQVLSLLTGMNLNCICCPPSTDPFYGKYYRVAAFFHQSVMILLTGRLLRLCIYPFVKEKLTWPRKGYSQRWMVYDDTANDFTYTRFIQEISLGLKTIVGKIMIKHLDINNSSKIVWSYV